MQRWRNQVSKIADPSSHKAASSDPGRKRPFNLFHPIRLARIRREANQSSGTCELKPQRMRRRGWRFPPRRTRAWVASTVNPAHGHSWVGPRLAPSTCSSPPRFSISHTSIVSLVFVAVARVDRSAEPPLVAASPLVAGPRVLARRLSQFAEP